VVIAPPTVTVPGGTTVFSFPGTDNQVQNGDPDGILLFNTVSNQPLDALSYRGSITAATVNGAPGTYNLVEDTATSAADSGTFGGSLNRIPNGVDTNNASTDWAFSTTVTPGATNVP
jgi:large repetitive protein